MGRMFSGAEEDRRVEGMPPSAQLTPHHGTSGGITTTTIFISIYCFCWVTRPGWGYR